MATERESESERERERRNFNHVPCSGFILSALLGLCQSFFPSAETKALQISKYDRMQHPGVSISVTRHKGSSVCSPRMFS
jgi:hypothetical protein